MKRVLAIVVILLAGSAVAQEFSAKFASPSKKELQGTVYVAGTRMRAEIMDGSKLRVMLLDVAKKPKLTQLNPEDKTFSVLELDDPELRAFIRWLRTPARKLCDIPDMQSCKFLGMKALGERVCDQYEIVDNGDETSQVCFDEELHLPIAYKSKEDEIELSDVKPGKQPEWLFVVPRKYKEVSFF